MRIESISIRVSQIPIFCFIFLVWIGTVKGQSLQKQMLTINDYKLWSQLYVPQISPDGDWVSFQLDYEGKSDSLVLINSGNQKKYLFSQSESGKFANNGKNFAFVAPQGVGVINLKSEAVQWIDGADRYKFSKTGDHIISYRPIEEDSGALKIMDLSNGNSVLIYDVKKFVLSDSGLNLAYIAKGDEGDTVSTVDLQTYKKQTVPSSQNGSLRQVHWNREGNALLFTEMISDSDFGNKERIVFYKEGQQDSKILPLEQLISYEPRMQFIEDSFFSDDGKEVLFYVGIAEDMQVKTNISQAEVEIWKGEDKRTRSSLRYYGGGNRGPWLMTWMPESGQVFQIANKDYPNAILTEDEKYAIIYSEDDYDPDTRQNPQVDLYLANLEDGTRHLVAKKIVASYATIRLSPTGRFISYFKEAQWWNYDISTRKHYQLTKDIPHPFYNIHHDSAGEALAYGNPGWTSGDKEIILYDQYDIWLLNNDGTNPRRLTKGRESNICYRMQLPVIANHRRSTEFYGAEYSSGNGFAVSAKKSDHSIAYYVLRKNGNLELLAKHNNKLTALQSSEARDSYSYVEQSFDLPPRIWLKNKGGKNRLIYQTNPHYKNFKTGPVERISYKSKDGEPLQGILFYPDDYEPGEKYPMIVKIYERLSQNYYNYINPSQYEQDGFNPRLYTAEGYAVLYPDISYVLQNPGVSATECVTSAVKATLEKGMVDKTRLGLIGHSFGGYEAAFIITQTNIFAAAVAGAPATDLTSFYFNIGWNSGKPDMWRFEDQQWRFGCSYFEKPEAYIRNSPLHQAEGISTPVLLWSGRKDLQVAHAQTLEFYLALKRLKKETTLLIYPNEAHSLINGVDQKDLSTRIKSWFNDHLKTKPFLR